MLEKAVRICDANSVVSTVNDDGKLAPCSQLTISTEFLRPARHCSSPRPGKRAYAQSATKRAIHVSDASRDEPGYIERDPGLSQRSNSAAFAAGVVCSDAEGERG